MITLCISYTAWTIVCNYKSQDLHPPLLSQFNISLEDLENSSIKEENKKLEEFVDLIVSKDLSIRHLFIFNRRFLYNKEIPDVRLDMIKKFTTILIRRLLPITEEISVNDAAPQIQMAALANLNIPKDSKVNNLTLSGGAEAIIHFIHKHQWIQIEHIGSVNVTHDNIGLWLKIFNYPGFNNSSIFITNYSSFDLVRQIIDQMSKNAPNAKIDIVFNSLEDNFELLKMKEKLVMQDIIAPTNFCTFSTSNDVCSELDKIESRLRDINEKFKENYEKNGISAILELNDQEPTELKGKTSNRQKNVVKDFTKNWTKYKLVDNFMKASEENQQALIDKFSSYGSNLSFLLKMLKDNIITAEQIKSAIDPKSPFSSIENFIKIIPGFKENFQQYLNNPQSLTIITQQCQDSLKSANPNLAYVFTEKYLNTVVQRSLFAFNKSPLSINQLIKKELFASIGEFKKYLNEQLPNIIDLDVLAMIAVSQAAKNNESRETPADLKMKLLSLNKNIEYLINDGLFSSYEGRIFSESFKIHVKNKLSAAISNSKITTADNQLDKLSTIIPNELNLIFQDICNDFGISYLETNEQSPTNIKRQILGKRPIEQYYKQQEGRPEEGEQEQNKRLKVQDADWTKLCKTIVFSNAIAINQINKDSSSNLQQHQDYDDQNCESNIMGNINAS